MWIWLLQEPKRIGYGTLQEIRSRANELWLSPISTFEAFTLHQKNRVRLHGDPHDWLARATAGTQEAPLTHEIALLARQLPMHKDPVDRILAATAQILDLVLVTGDEKLLGLPTIKTLANR
jgi:PIN domain nuclease of toxin-antitoxin system